MPQVLKPKLLVIRFEPSCKIQHLLWWSRNFASFCDQTSRFFESMPPKKYTCRHPCPPWWTSVSPVVGFPCCQHWKSWPESCWVLKIPTLKRMLPCSGQVKNSISNIWFHKSLSNSWKPVINLSMWCTVKWNIEASHLRRWRCYRDIDLCSPNSKIPSPKQKKYEVTFEKFPPFSSMKEQPTAKLEKNMYLKATNGTRSSLQVSRTMMELLKLTVLPWSTREGDVNPKGGGDSCCCLVPFGSGPKNLEWDT